MSPTSSSSSGSTPFTQGERQFRFETALGKDALVVAGFTCEEAVSRPYRLVVQLVSEDANVPIDKILRQPASLSVGLFGNGGERYFQGFVSRFSQGARVDGRTHYEAEIVPWLYYLAHAHDFRIFQNMSVPEIIDQIFGEHSGGVNYSWKTLKQYPKREYVCQWDESQFAFISRLLEDEGIFYWFEHAKDKHTMVLADGTSAIKPCPGLSKAVRMDTILGDSYEQNVVSEVAREHVAFVNRIAMRDYNFLTPTNKLESVLSGEGKDKEETFEFPGGYGDNGEGDRYATLRLEEQEAMRLRSTGASNVRSFKAGYKFELSEHYRKDVNGFYQLLEVVHTGTAGSLAMGGKDSYGNTFVATPIANVFRPPRATPRPHPTMQSAVVVGKSGEDIWVDKYGRVKVQFHWDRRGKKDENSSCWVRVASTWAGKGWGAIRIPRIGQEVLVDFIDGDVDRPVIVGSVYNADNMPPWTLPANQTQSGVLSRSSKGGGAANANMIRFEDKAGEEVLLVHAEKDHVVEVEHDETHTVDNDRKSEVKNDDELKVGKKLTIDAGEEIVLKCGLAQMTFKQDGTIELKGMGISVKGDTEVKVEGGASVKVKSSGQTSVEGAAMTEVKSSGIVQVQGSLVKIN